MSRRPYWRKRAVYWRHRIDKQRRLDRLSRRTRLRRKALANARALIGVMEQGGNNAGKKVMEIIRANGGTGPEAWCGDFAAFVYRLAGSKAVTRSWAVAWWIRAVKGVRITRRPKPGHLAVFNFGQGHVGIVEEWLEGGWFYCIEGNTGPSGAVSDSTTGGDGVYRKRRHVSQVREFVEVLR